MIIKNYHNSLVLLLFIRALTCNALFSVNHSLQEYIRGTYNNDVEVSDIVEQKKSQKNFFYKMFVPKNAREFKASRIFSKQDQATIAASFFGDEVTLPIMIIKDLEIVNETQSLAKVLSQISPTRTILGEITFVEQLMNPTINRDSLTMQQNIVRALSNNSEVITTLQFYFDKIAKLESSLLKFFDDNSMLSSVESEIIYSKTMLIGNLINTYAPLYNMSLAIPTILTTVSIPFSFYGAAVALYRVVAYSMKKDFEQKISQLEKINEKKLGRILTSDETKDIRESITKKTEEDLRGLSQQEKDDIYLKLQNPDLDEELKNEFHGQLMKDVTTNFLRNSALEEPTLIKSAKFINESLTLLNSLTDGNWNKNLLKWLGTPAVFLGIREVTSLFAIASKGKEIQKYLSDVSEYIEIAKKIEAIVLDFPELVTLDIIRQFNLFNKNSEIKGLLGSLQKTTFRTYPSCFSDWGNIFVTLREMQSKKDHFIPLMKAIGVLDSYVAVGKLMLENSNHFCFTNFLEFDTPIITAVNFWDPFMLTHKNIDEIITNSISLGHDVKNVILTGPNTCGKTTVIVGIALNVILAQTFGIAAAKQFDLTPFNHFNVTLTIGTEGAIGDSRFKAEVRQAKKVLNTVENAYNEGEFCLTIQDEIFTGTNQNDGSVAAYNFLQKLGQYKNNITIIATHYPKLTTLEAYTNFKINAEVKNDRTIIRYYTIAPGISDLNIAHILTRDAGLS